MTLSIMTLTMITTIKIISIVAQADEYFYAQFHIFKLLYLMSSC